tara:strand:+ start:1064 stop:1978 length:915 start_codon:yes stop_codon:yes gene_type:complete
MRYLVITLGVICLLLLVFCFSQEKFGYKPREPELYDSEFLDEWLDPNCLKILEQIEKGVSPDKISDLRNEGDGVYSYPCVTVEFANKLLDEVKNYEASGEEIRRPNSMNNYGVILNEMGMKDLMDSLQVKLVKPLAKVLFPEIGNGLSGHHTFTVRYNAGEDKSLDMHTDDSDVTFNLCLGEKFKGCKLQFCGDISKHDHRHHSLTYFHEVGRAVMHLGSRRHGADDIEEGTRTNLVMWSYNPEYRKKPKPSGEKESGPPDLLCLSWTHDRDFNSQMERLTGKKDSREPSTKAWCPKRGHEFDT